MKKPPSSTVRDYAALVGRIRSLQARGWNDARLGGEVMIEFINEMPAPSQPDTPFANAWIL